MFSSKKYQAVLFDFDGVLAQTMEDNYKAWVASLNRYGIPLTGEEYFPFEGMKLEKLAEKYCKKAGLEKSFIKEVVKTKEENYMKNHTFKFYPGVGRIINTLVANNVLLAIVTGGLYNRLNSTLPSNFLKKFNTVITGEQTKRGKPYPDPYLKAAQILSVDIKNCIVVENAPLGIRSAKQAGAYCIAVSSTMKKEFLLEADEVIPKISDLKTVAVFIHMFNNLNQSRYV